MHGKFFIHAIGINQGGGDVLLRDLLREANSLDLQVIVLLDRRMVIRDPCRENISFISFSSSIKGRLKAEKWLVNNTNPRDILLCFSNLPPLFKLVCRVVVFIHTRYIVEGYFHKNMSFQLTMNEMIKKWWLLWRKGNADTYLVQTPTMKRLLSAKINMPISVIPFAPRPEKYNKQSYEKKVINGDVNFVYIASGEIHKNHKTLIEAWCLLAEEDYFPILKLTLDKDVFSELCDWIDIRVKSLGLKVENLGELSHEEVLKLYDKVNALIYPSYFESFGLPLIEAQQAGLPVLAPELDYVRDILDPTETFDPYSSISIMRAVKRFVGVSQDMLPLTNAATFLSHVIDEN